MVLVFAYVDIFSLYRAEVLEDLQNGKIYKFEVTDTFLFFTTLFIVVPCLMIFFTLIMRTRVNRVVNIGVAVVYAIVCLGSAVGEWNYYIFGSVVEALLLGGVIYYAQLLDTARQPATPHRSTPG